jgi:signal peptidase
VSAIAVLWFLIGLGIGLAAAVVLPLPFGARSLTVMSGSMEPALSTGDVVVVRPVPPLAARVGDVVTFPSPDGGDHLITHRVRHLHALGGTVEFETKGDANNATERWSVTEGGEIGRVVYRVRKLGYVLHWAGLAYGRLLFFALPVLGLGALTLLRTWRDEPRPAPGAREPPSPESPALLP